MQEGEGSRIGFIGDFSRYSLIGILIVNILSPFVIIFINPEVFFLGQKIAGTLAQVYALGLILITTLLVFSLYKKSKGYAFIALAYGTIYFVNGYLIAGYYNGQVPPAIYWLILVLSVMVFCTTLIIQSGKPVEPYKKSICRVFADKPYAGLLLSLTVLICFLLFTSISLSSYQKEFDTYLYQVEIYPDTPLYNVTLMMPLPSAISGNIADGNNWGNDFPGFQELYPVGRGDRKRHHDKNYCRLDRKAR